MVAILFDLEDTLVQSIGNNEKAILEFRIATRKKLLDLGIPVSVLKNVTKSTLMRNIALEYVEKQYNVRDARQFLLEIDRFLKKYELAWANQSKIFPDTQTTLIKLRELGYKMAVITNTSREAAKLMLSIHGITDFFELIITREDVKKLKPDPEGILLALKMLDEQDFFFVGDLVHDLNAAKKAGGKCIIVNRTFTEKLDFRADYTVQSLEEIPGLIQNIS